jgi:hypothetical protein
MKRPPRIDLSMRSNAQSGIRRLGKLPDCARKADDNNAALWRSIRATENPLSLSGMMPYYSARNPAASLEACCFRLAERWQSG